MKTVKNRKRKFALGIKIAAMLSCVAIASVGFASWLIISNPADTDPSQGSITASTVTEQGLAFETPTWGEASDGDSDIVFGKPTDPIADAWLVAGNDVQSEDLKATLTLKYTPTNIKEADITVKFNVCSANGAIDTTTWANVKDYVGIKMTIGEGTAVECDATGTITATTKLTNGESVLEARTLTVKIEFYWKLDDSHSNPYVFFNTGHKPGDSYNETTTYAAHAKTVLEAVYDNLNGRKYQVVISGKVVPNTAS